MVAAAFSLILGIARALNLAHGEMVLLGGYVTFALWQWTGLSPLLLAPVAALALVPLGLLWRWLLARVREPYELQSLVLTFGLSLLLQNAFLGLFKADYRLLVVPGLEAPVGWGLSRGRLVTAVSSLALIGLLHWVLTRSTWGRAVRATSLDRAGAALVGINTDRTTLAAFALAAALAGGAGALFATAHYLYPAAGVELTLLAIVLTILGGVGRLTGLLLAGIVVGVAEALTVAWTSPQWRELVAAVLLLGLLHARSRGLARGRLH